MHFDISPVLRWRLSTEQEECRPLIRLIILYCSKKCSLSVLPIGIWSTVKILATFETMKKA